MPTSANKTYASADPGSSAKASELGGPHGGGPRGTPLRLGTRSRHGRRAPRGAPLHGGRQQQNPWLGAIARCSRTGSSNPSPSSGQSVSLRISPPSQERRGFSAILAGLRGGSVGRDAQSP